MSEPRSLADVWFSFPEVSHVYKKPMVERFGSFRELTRLGIRGGSDGLSIWGPDGSVTGCQIPWQGNDIEIIPCPPTTS